MLYFPTATHATDICHLPIAFLEGYDNVYFSSICHTLFQTPNRLSSGSRLNVNPINCRVPHTERDNLIVLFVCTANAALAATDNARYTIFGSVYWEPELSALRWGQQHARGITSAAAIG